MNGVQILSVLSMCAMALAQPMDKRAVSYVTDLPEDAYKDDDKVTIIIAATVGGIAGLVCISCVVFAIIRRRKRGPIVKRIEDVEEANKPVQSGFRNMAEPQFGYAYEQPLVNEQAHFPSAPDLARMHRESTMGVQSNVHTHMFDAENPPPVPR
ncbi:hypothetical protein GGH96_006072 [Coemansia sp. RSA 1972]|nr:hypothetical protein GGH96_006072 [Coemansia sp. RSA 1972]